MPRGAAPGERRGGRAKGTPNKKTVERRIAKEIDVARAQGLGEREFGKDVLERMMRLAEGAAGLHRPPTPAQVAAAQAQEDEAAKREGREPRRVAAGDWPLFGEWFDRTVYCAKELAKYQSPQMRAILMTPPPPLLEPRTIEGERADNVVDLHDANELAKIYQRRVQAVR